MIDPLDQFIQTKKENSPFVSLKSGESIRGRLLSYKLVTKSGFNGEEKDVVRYELETITSDDAIVKKNFDNSTTKFATQIKSMNVKPGTYLTITRQGDGPKTLYIVSNVSNSMDAPASDITPVPRPTTTTPPAKTIQVKPA
jgi:hypothetical protein